MAIFRIVVVYITCNQLEMHRFYRPADNQRLTIESADTD